MFEPWLRCQLHVREGEREREIEGGRQGGREAGRQGGREAERERRWGGGEREQGIEGREGEAEGNCF